MTNKEAIEEIKSMGLIIDAATSRTRRKSIYEALTLAIKALEERPIDDLSEYSDKLWQKAYERGKAEARPTVDTTCPNCDSGYAQGYSDGYLKGKEERPQGGWTPIGERLPDYMEETLVTIQVNNREPKVRSGFYAYGCFHNDNGDVWKWNDPEVKAWMPLPEAYKEEENNEP